MQEQNKDPKEHLPPSQEPEKSTKEKEEELFKHSDKNGPNPAGNPDVKPEDQNSG